jgi:ribosomal protein L11 methyltransferase
LEEVIQGGEEVIDVGTGSGILAIGACLLGASRVLALDLDPVAVSSARENAKLNGLAERIVVKESDLLQIIRLGEQQDAADRYPHTGAADPLGIRLPVQIVCANILADVILKFIDDVYRVLSPGGIYIASGIYKNKEQDVQEALIRSGFSVDRISREEDWAAIVAVKR